MSAIGPSRRRPRFPLLRQLVGVDRKRYLVTQLNRPNQYGERYCDGKIAVRNYIYPIAGLVGVNKTVRTFVNLTVFGS